MSGSEFEIEYLEEDAEIVQQCVTYPDENNQPLLVKRLNKPGRKRKNNYQEDSDYVPQLHENSSTSKGEKKKKKPSSYSEQKSQKTSKASDQKVHKEIILKQKKSRPLVKLTDYIDSLCLPARMSMRNSNDLRRWKSWNNMCMEYFKSLDTDLKPKNGSVNKSKKTVVFKNVKNKDTYKVETTMWSKTQVFTDTRDSKAEVLQGVLPKYKERYQLSFPLATHKSKKVERKVSEAILTKDNLDKEEILVVFKPQHAETSYYKLLENCLDEEKPIIFGKMEETAKRRCVKEIANFKMCASCYQASWRPAAQDYKNAQCAVCKRKFTSLYNLLSHLKMHPAEDVREHQETISRTLASIVKYHYTCRICSKKASTIKRLRRHILNTHRGNEPFVCEIGGHVAL